MLQPSYSSVPEYLSKPALVSVPSNLSEPGDMSVLEVWSGKSKRAGKCECTVWSEPRRVSVPKTLSHAQPSFESVPQLLSRSA